MSEIVLKDRDGNAVTHEVSTGKINLLMASGEAKEFVNADDIPTVLEDLLVALDFSNGDQPLVAPNGAVVKSAIIQQPETLIPENIAEGVDIAGIIGTMSGGSGGSSDWNCFVRIFTAPGTPEDTSQPFTLVTAEELVQNGITVYPYGATTNHLKTIVFMTRINTGSSTSGTAKRLNFAYFQNWQMSNNGTSTYYNGITDYQSATTTVKVQESYQTTTLWSIGSNGPIRINQEKGLAYVNSSYSSNYPIGTYLVCVLQHKTALVSDTLT